MKKAIYMLALSFAVISCDPTSSMEAYITNTTPSDLTITFVASEESGVDSRTLQVGANETVLFQEGFDVGSTYIEPSLTEFDSVYIQNSDQEVLKVFKETSGIPSSPSAT